MVAFHKEFRIFDASLKEMIVIYKEIAMSCSITYSRSRKELGLLYSDFRFDFLGRRICREYLRGAQFL